MEPEVAGSHLDITIGAELTALKRTVEELTILQYHMRSMRIMAYHHVGKHVLCRWMKQGKSGQGITLLVHS
eukprot:1944439-Ditylum_brightwellii.AAC.1